MRKLVLFGLYLHVRIVCVVCECSCCMHCLCKPVYVCVVGVLSYCRRCVCTPISHALYAHARPPRVCFPCALACSLARKPPHLHVALPCESVVGRSKGVWMDGSANETDHRTLGSRRYFCLRPSPHILITLSGNVRTVWILFLLVKRLLLSRTEGFKIAELGGS